MKIKILSGKHKRESCPVSIALDFPPGKALSLFELKGREVPCQQESNPRGKGVILSFIVNNIIPAGEKTYQIVSSPPSSSFPQVTLKESPKKEIEVKIKGKLFTKYQFSKEIKKPYLYPIVGPFSRPLTDNGPSDHIHHRSLWLAHGEVNRADLWSEEKGSGRMVHQKFKELKEGLVYAKLWALNNWVDNKGRKILSEERCFKIYNLPLLKKIIDLEIILRAGDKKVILGPTKEAGSLAVRVAPSMTGKEGGKIENSYGGRGEKETWGKRALWCDYSGIVDEREVGIAIFDHPQNWYYPSFWHVRDYGLMAVNSFYFSGESYKILPKQELKFLYRVYIHPGGAKEGEVQEGYLNYIHPPLIKIE